MKILYNLEQTQQRGGDSKIPAARSFVRSDGTARLLLLCSCSMCRNGQDPGFSIDFSGETDYNHAWVS